MDIQMAITGVSLVAGCAGVAWGWNRHAKIAGLEADVEAWKAKRGAAKVAITPAPCTDTPAVASGTSSTSTSPADTAQHTAAHTRSDGGTCPGRRRASRRSSRCLGDASSALTAWRLERTATGRHPEWDDGPCLVRNQSAGTKVRSSVAAFSLPWVDWKVVKICLYATCFSSSVTNLPRRNTKWWNCGS